MHFSKANVREARQYRFFVDGVEITNRVIEADDVEGYAVCYVLRPPKPDDRPGVLYWLIENHKPVTETLTGKVEFRRIDE